MFLYDILKEFKGSRAEQWAQEYEAKKQGKPAPRQQQEWSPAAQRILAAAQKNPKTIPTIVSILSNEPAYEAFSLRLLDILDAILTEEVNKWTGRSPTREQPAPRVTNPARRRAAFGRVRDNLVALAKEMSSDERERLIQHLKSQAPEGSIRDEEYSLGGALGKLQKEAQRLIIIARQNPSYVPEMIDMLIGVENAMAHMENEIVTGLILTEKANDLNNFLKAWTKAGRPRDMSDIMKILQSLGASWPQTGKAVSKAKKEMENKAIIPAAEKQQIQELVSAIKGRNRRKVMQELKAIYQESRGGKRRKRPEEGRIIVP